MPELRVLGSIYRQMQRPGYLKRLIWRVNTLSTSNLSNLGNDLVETVTRKVQVPLDNNRATYIKQRLQDRTYQTLKAQATTWLARDQVNEPPSVAMELQDLYLADPTLPSQVGKLVSEDWRRYPALGLALGFIRAGTYSSNTRALSLLHLTSESELRAFSEYRPEDNPLLLTRQQALLLLYALIENDGEIVMPLWSRLANGTQTTFSDRDAGDLLPEIYRSVITRHRKGSIPAEQRDRLVVLEKSADSIAARREKPYTGGSAREEASAPRVEPYTDIGLLEKPDHFKYEYRFTPAGQVWTAALAGVTTSEQIADLLAHRFFTTAAQAWVPTAQPLSDTEQVIRQLYRAWEAIRSSGGYAPIEEFALVAGIRALLDDQCIIEPAVARETLIAYQKANPYQVRFTVDRMGTLAHARFLAPPFTTMPNTS